MRVQTFNRSSFFEAFPLKKLTAGGQFNIYANSQVVVKIRRSYNEFRHFAAQAARYAQQAGADAGEQTTKLLYDQALKGYQNMKARGGGLVIPFEMPDWLEFTVRRWLVDAQKILTREGIVQLRVPQKDTFDFRLARALKTGDYELVNQLLDQMSELLYQVIRFGGFIADPQPNLFAYHNEQLMVTDCGMMGFKKNQMLATLREKDSRQGLLRTIMEKHRRFVMGQARHRDHHEAENVMADIKDLFEEIFTPRVLAINWGKRKGEPMPDFFPLEVRYRPSLLATQKFFQF
jgi:hypothetical protein